MTDDRQPERQPDGPEPSGSPEPSATPGPSAMPDPPPLAPLVTQPPPPEAEALADTSRQPTATWAQDQTTYTPPPIPPPAVQPSASCAPPPAPIAAASERTALAAAAGIVLVVLGILGALAGLAIATIGRGFVDAIGDFGTIPGMEGVDADTFISGFILFFGIIIVAYSLVYAIAGVGVLRGRNWGRILGIIVGILSGLVWLTGLSGGGNGARNDIAGTALLLAAHVYIVVALAFFWRARTAPR